MDTVIPPAVDAARAALDAAELRAGELRAAAATADDNIRAAAVTPERALELPELRAERAAARDAVSAQETAVTAARATLATAERAAAQEAARAAQEAAQEAARVQREAEAAAHAARLAGPLSDLEVMVGRARDANAHHHLDGARGDVLPAGDDAAGGGRGAGRRSR